MDREKLIKRLMATFLEELQEHVAALNRDLLALEKGADGRERAERFKTLFRTAHSLKGASRSVSVGLLEGACHRLEEILGGARDGKLPLGPELFALLFATADAIEEAGMRLREQQDLSDAPLARLVPALDAAARGEAPSPPATPASPGRPPTEEKPPSTPPEPAGAPATVRVLAEKLDALLAESGELLVGRQRAEARVEELREVREFVGRWNASWRLLEKSLNKTLRGNGGRGAAPAALPRRAARVLQRQGENLRQLDRELERLTVTLAADGRSLNRAAEALDDEVRRVRLFPFAEACEGLDRMVRDLAHSSGKQVELAVEGGAVSLDRSVLEGFKDPLRHLVRNAVDHGVEPPDVRRAAGKPPRARVTVSAALRGSQVEVVVADDGRGLDLDALRRQLQQRGLPEPADERELAQAIFLPGLSTARLITDVSGRGVGCDVVKNSVEALHGTVEVSFTAGRGTRFTLAAPLTLTTLRALLVAAGGQTFAFVGTNVQKLVRVDPGRVRTVEGREVLALGGSPLPVAALADTLGLPAREAAGPRARALAVLVAAGEKRMAFVVDEFLAEQEIVVKNLGARVRRVRHVSGATILPSGRLALVLNAAELVRTALGQAPARPVAARAAAAPAAKKRLILAEDSLTTRTLEKSILEAAGYEVLAAADGAAAWRLLQERGADLVVTDVDMPLMDGFDLTEAVRGSPRFAGLPVILVTARETEADRARGAAVGANAYLLKSAFDQRNLLETIAQLL